ncbi:unnamed protein product [Cuscuta epithymum]|uniref:Uncharacterized protein n=1 Tax=Cuscuta epithymum TaxID=186058 RepID=A0AAV0F0L4_9ASTE|nr:unnamed protein product [Cuscuta epithymum]
MNFLLMRSNQAAAPAELPPAIQPGTSYVSKPSSGTLGALFAEDPLLQTKSFENHDGDSDGHGNDSGFIAGSIGTGNHIEVTEGEGWIAIPKKELPDNWSEAPDITSLRLLDRFFVFPGEQVQVLACLSAYKKDTEIITPFKVAELMNKKGLGENNHKEGGSDVTDTHDVSDRAEINDCEDINKTNKIKMQGNVESEKEVSAGASLLRMEDYKRQTESLLRRFKNSHFFVRIAGSEESLWTKRKLMEDSSGFDEMFMGIGLDARHTTKKKPPSMAAIDRGNFDSITSGGVGRNAAKCCALPNGNIGVLLQINVGVEFVRDPVLEILQFEKSQDRSLSSAGHENSVCPDQDPCGELLKWLLPLDNSIPPPARSLTPPHLTSTASIRSTSTRVTLSGPTGSQLFSFGNLRSYSMSSLPQNSLPPSSTSTPNSGPSFEPEDWERFSFRKAIKSENSGSRGLLSYRGVSLEPERFSVHCGLEGIYIPGRKWRKKIEIIQPLEITSFASHCSINDLICVQVKNVAPEHTPDIVVYIDAISIVFEEASKNGPPLSLPTACIEAGSDHCLPNLALRRGEEHSFILKPATSMGKRSKVSSEKSSQLSSSSPGNVASTRQYSLNDKWRNSVSPADRYAILVSCRCNYTGSKLFFKQPISWRPRIFRDLMISVASEGSKQTLGSNDRAAELPSQVLTLQASNLTSEDLTMTVLAPSFTSLPSVMSVSSPTSPGSPFIDSSRLSEKVNDRKVATSRQSASAALESKAVQVSSGHKRSVSFDERVIYIPDIHPSSDSGCSHLWLQSRVPLGCVPSQSTATVKLEVLPLTDGIITLDSLQIEVKEKGLTYIPEHSLKIYATSSISIGVQ